MHVAHLSLTNFRNYRRLDLELPASPVVIQGENAQGKTNLLESMYVLATTRSHRTSSDSELLCHDARDDDLPVARAVADARRARGEVKVEVVLRAERAAAEGGEAAPGLSSVRKQVRVNG